MGRVEATRHVEDALWRIGFVHVAGVDEVGRGCLAGPVVAAAVILRRDSPIARLADSKLVPPRERERLSALIRARALAWAIAEVGPADIDRMAIHHASIEAMRRAALRLAPLPDVVLVDAFRIPGLPFAQRGVVHGDRLCASIAAASIVAKAHRDDLMRALDAADDRYGYARHKGYATPQHLAAIARFGYSPEHRRSFRPASLFGKIGAGNRLADPV
ncbi:MAG TPA: ribonuclease HII [Vicinamibacterales bacterium]|nr:ribonuclease HII [Vicinamibacterales bacterium]HPK72720.1 ribonuclease HII [Vicinamibacterales bacterium]